MNLRNIKLIIEYDGGRYKGWQRLEAAEATIQGKLEEVISKMLNTDTEIIGSGRTDAGAHARMQVANFHTSSNMTIEEMRSYINHYLPQDIVVKGIEEVEERFHSRYNVKSKAYIYQIWNSSIPSAFQRKYSLHIPVVLNISEMKKAAEKLTGTHDFIAFSSVKKTNKSTVRTISEIKIERVNEMVLIRVEGDGFLYNMVRIIVGTLIEVGLGRKAPEYIDSIFKAGKRLEAGQTVAAQGLFLQKVNY